MGRGGRSLSSRAAQARVGDEPFDGAIAVADTADDDKLPQGIRALIWLAPCSERRSRIIRPAYGAFETIIRPSSGAPWPARR